MKPVLFLIVLASFLYSYDEHYIASAIKKVASDKKIDAKILYTIIDIESDFSPYAISMLTSKKNALAFKKINNKHVKVIASEYSLNKKKWAVSFRPTSLVAAKELASVLLKQGFNIDVGLSQINSVNFKKSEVKYIFEPYFNLTKSSTVLRSCANRKKEIKKIIECYNYGYRDRGSYPYFNRFINSYRKNFGV